MKKTLLGFPLSSAILLLFSPDCSCFPRIALLAQEASAPSSKKENEQALLEPFRFGCITSKRVRMRTAAQIDAPILRELPKDTPLKISSETDGFYAVIPPFPTKAYVSRRYVLDGKIEGERVNVRSEPSPEAPILTQVSSGYLVEGKIDPENPKWLEIDLPPTTRFYISRDYVSLIEETRFKELAKNFQSSLVTVKSPLHPTEPTRPAPDLVDSSLPWKETKGSQPETPTYWQIQEQNIENSWLLLHAPATTQDYENFLTLATKELKGKLERYHGPIFSPGDFVLEEEGRILAILYSAKIDLTPYLGQKIQLKAIERENRDFAYPVFCVRELF